MNRFTTLGGITAQNIKELRQSDLFDPEYYKSHFSIDWECQDPVEHYLENWRDYPVPTSPAFDSCKYMALYPETFASALPPLLHFLLIGKWEGRKALAVNEPLDKQTAFASLELKGDILSTIHYRHKRAAIFAAYDADFKIRDSLIHYLEELNEICDAIIFISDNYFPVQEILKIRHLIKYYECRRHGCYDFGSYRRGLEVAYRENIPGKVDELVICNDSVYGPGISMKRILTNMEQVNCDFWGMLNNAYYVPEHIQSYFMVFRKPVLKGTTLMDYFRAANVSNDATETIRNCEVPLTAYLEGKGFARSQYMDVRKHPAGTDAAVNNYNLTLDPAYCLREGLPLIKKRPLNTPLVLNRSGNAASWRAFRDQYPFLCNMAAQESDICMPVGEDAPSFSLIMGTYNRVHILPMSIDSVLAQSYQNFELIIVDDGSTDDTGEMIQGRYADELASGKIVYKKLAKNGGICRARNVGQKLASREWIGYVDSDNTIRPMFLEYFSMAIRENPENRCFYSRFVNTHSVGAKGRVFDYQRLLKGNYIDLGGFVHHRDLMEELGGFDERMRRLVDYELILRYTGVHKPFYIAHPLLEYNNGTHFRISTSENYATNETYIRKKYHLKRQITTIITCFSPDADLLASVESALCQRGDFTHEIVILVPQNFKELAETAKRLQADFSTLVDVRVVETLDLSTLASLDTGHASLIAFLSANDYWPYSDRLDSADKALREYGDADLCLCGATLVKDAGIASSLSNGREIKENFQMDESMAAWLGDLDILSTLVIPANRLSVLSKAKIVGKLDRKKLASSIIAHCQDVVWVGDDLVTVYGAA